MTCHHDSQEVPEEAITTAAHTPSGGVLVPPSMRAAAALLHVMDTTSTATRTASSGSGSGGEGAAAGGGSACVSPVKRQAKARDQQQHQLGCIVKARFRCVAPLTQ